MSATVMRAEYVKKYANPGTVPNRVRITDEETHPRTINGKFAGCLPRPEYRGREGTFVGYEGPGALIWLDGDCHPIFFSGGTYRCID